MQLPEMPSWDLIAISLLLIGVLTFGITQVVKMFCRHWIVKKEGDPDWWQALFMLIPIVMGAGVGALFFAFPWGVSIGASAGVMSAVLYKKAVGMLSAAKIAGIQAVTPEDAPADPIAEPEIK